MLKKALLLCGVALILIYCSWAGAEEKPVDLGVFTVTAPVGGQSIQDVQATIEVIDEAELRSFSRRSLADVLQYATGFFIRGGASTSRINLRGFDDDHTLILVDGMRRTVKYGNTSADLVGLQLEEVERIEIVRGPMSALYGSEALAGVINIVTKRSSGQRSLTTTIVGGGAEKDQRGTGILSGSMDLGTLGKSRHRVSFEGKKRDDLRVDTDTRYTDLPDEEKLFFSYRGNYDFEADHGLCWDFEYYDQDDEGISSAGNYPTYEEETRYHFGTKYFNSLAFGDLELNLAYGKNDAESDRTSGAEETDYEQTEGNLFFTRSFFDNHTVTIGFGGRQQTIDHTIYSDVPDRENYNVFIQDQWTIWNVVTLVAGVRYDDYNDFGSTTNPRFTLAWHPGNWNVRVGYGEGFKAPNFSELYSSFTRSSGNRTFYVSGDPNLGPEESKSYEAAISYQKRRFGVEVVYHYTELEDLITSVSTLRPPTGGNFIFDTVYQNVSEAEIEGLEVTLAFNPWDFLEITGAWEYLDKIDGETDERLTDYPKNKAKLSVRANYGKANAAFRFLRIMDFYAAGLSRTNEESNYTQVDFRIGYELFKGHELFGGIDNMFDEETPENWNRGGGPNDAGERYYYVGYTFKWY